MASISPHSTRSPCRVPAGVIALAASAVHGQSCIWTPYPNVPYFPGALAVAYHSGLQKVVAVNGQNSEGYPTTLATWAWDGAAWTLLDANGPVRLGHAIAYDSARDRLVLFGGVTGYPYTYFGDTWEWDGTAWTRVATSGPSPRTTSLVYDASRHRTVLFGGGAGYGTAFGDTWEWDGQAWTLAATTGPSPRGVGLFAYDSIRARTVICGGYNATSAYLTDLWEWDGVAWTQRPTTVPRYDFGFMVFDPSRARMILGYDSSYGYRETWELDPSTLEWTLRFTGSWVPWPARAAFDVARSRAVLVEHPTWEYDGAGTALAPYMTQQPVGGEYLPGASATLTVQAGGTAPFSYQWRRDGQPLANGGNISGATTASLAINPLTAADDGSYDALVANGCGTTQSSPARVSIYTGCWANCDHSTTPPCLNVLDFICFLNKFAAGDTYANCDSNCPLINCLDFGCFLNKFAAGCSDC